MDKSPFEIFRQHAELTRVDNPIYKKVWKPKMSRAFVPIPRSWWSRYGFKWELDIVKVTMTARVRDDRIRIPFSNQVHSYLVQELPSERINYQVTTYEFQPVRLIQIIQAEAWLEFRDIVLERMTKDFWRQAEPLINEGTRVAMI